MKGNRLMAEVVMTSAFYIKERDYYRKCSSYIG